MNSQRVRPVGVTIIAVLMVLGGIVGVVSGLFFVPMTGMMGMNYLGTLGAVAGGFFVALGIASFVMAWGLLNGKSWAWTITLIIIIIDLIIGFVSVNFISLIIDGIILYYLFRPHVKSYFGKGEMVL